MTDVSIRILSPGDEPAVEAFLLPQLEGSMFLLGNMRTAGLVDNGEPLQGTYVAAFEGDKIIAIAAQFWNGNIMVQAKVHLPQLVRAAIKAAGREVKGCLGLADQVEQVVAELGLDLSVENIKVDERSGLYTLALEDLLETDLLKSKAVRGRLIEEGDVELVTQWLVTDNLETMGEDDTQELYDSINDRVKRAVKRGAMWVLEDDRGPIALSGFNAMLDEAVQIGPVYTPTENRCRGYAKSAVATSLLHARREGVKQAILFTGDDNLPAIKAYTAIGFKQVGNYYLLLLRSGPES